MEEKRGGSRVLAKREKGRSEQEAFLKNSGEKREHPRIRVEQKG